MRRGSLVPVLLLAAACAGESGTTVGQDGPLAQRLEARLVAKEAELISFRRDLHRHPELSGQEQRTAAAVAARLRDLGFAVRTGVGGHGVVGLLRGDRPGPVVAFRADMDAVSSIAPDPVSFASLTPGVRHICGHDVHTTVGIALAEAFSAVRDSLPGTVLLIFQPAEERATGARAMLASGVFGTDRPAAIFALHTAPLEVGQLGTTAGPLMASRDVVRIVAMGTGDRSAALAAARQVIEGVATVDVSRQFDGATGDFVLVQFGGGDPSTVVATLSLATEAARTRARETIAREVAALTIPSVALAVEYQARFIDGVTNDSGLVIAASAAIAAVPGAGTVVTIRSITPAFSEDFGAFQAVVPGAMYFLGVSNAARGTVGYPHAPAYVADEGSILVGARAMAAVILDRLRAGG